MSQVAIVRVSPPLTADRCSPQCIEEREVEVKLGNEKTPRRVTTHLSKTSYAVRYGGASREIATERAVKRHFSDTHATDYVIVGPNDFLN
jgi:hypothetical protein